MSFEIAFPKLINSINNTAIDIDKNEFIIGRGLTCDCILSDVKVSRQHCSLKKLDSTWSITDKSSNGTLVNNQLIKSTIYDNLKHGDSIEIGDVKYIFEFESEKEETEIAEVLDIVESLQTEIDNEKPTTSKSLSPPPTKKPKLDNSDADDEDLDPDLCCSICSELYVKAVTLNCSHTFCEYCIAEWKKRKCVCPVCRQKIVTLNHTLVLDNLIEKIVSNKSEDFKENRRKTIESRADKDGGSKKVEAYEYPVYDVSSEEDSFDSADEDDDYDDYEDYGSRRRSRNYYGGYGSCFCCGGVGHWANTCPLRRRMH